MGGVKDGPSITSGVNKLAYHLTPGAVGSSLVEEVTLLVHATVTLSACHLQVSSIGSSSGLI